MKEWTQHSNAHTRVQIRVKKKKHLEMKILRKNETKGKMKEGAK
jgi:hypothetical protein